MASKTIVLPSARSIRQRLLEHPSSLLDRYITMGEFLQKSVIVENLRFIDEDTRTVLLLEAADFENFKKLQIDRNFFTFTKNASYIFSFFEELGSEMVSLESITMYDLYGEYEEHIKILSELKRRYEALCLQHGLCDGFMLPAYYKLNDAYLKRATEIEIEVAGMLTNFELTLLEEMRAVTPIKLRFEADAYNVKMQDRLKERFGFELEEGSRYLLDLQSKSIIEQERIKSQENVELYALSGRTLQVALIKKKIYEYIQNGYDPSKIAVILPNESLKEHLELFDTKNNFNFAMGRSMFESFVYKKIRATLDALDESSVENEARLERYGDELYLQLFGSYKKRIGEIDMLPILESFIEYAKSNEEKRILKEEIYRFEKLLAYMQNLTLKAALGIFLSRLASRSQDDVGGGKITVMGVLETRSVSFDAVIVVDFNDANVPKRVEKDMFLSSAVRERVGLPSTQDREELQKHYYASLFRSAKEVCISYVRSESELPSRFLKELGLEKPKEVDEEDLAALLFAPGEIGHKEHRSFVVEYDFTASKLSNSKLSTFLTCKQKFFLRYIAGIQNFEIPKDVPDEWEIGRVLHTALKTLYTEKKHFETKEELCRELNKTLEMAGGGSELEKFQISLYKEILQKFCANEMRRFDKGWRVYKSEEPIEREYGGLKLYGVIDRIDKNEEGVLEVLDYKSGSIKLYTEKNVEGASDFQLEFYYLLAGTLGEVGQVGFYDLKEGKVVEETLFEQKLRLLEEHLRALKEIKHFEVSLCEDLKACANCEFKTICGRE